MNLKLWLSIGLLWMAASTQAAPQEVIPPSQQTFEESSLTAYKRRYRIERSDLLVYAMLRHAEKKWDAGLSAEAIKIAENAVAFSPDTPLGYFFLSHAVMRQGHPILAGQYYLHGFWNALHDFWFLISGFGIAAVTLFFALLLSFTTWVIYSMGTLAPLWVHQILEWTKPIISRSIAGLSLVVLFGLPFAVSLPPFWIFLFFFLLFWKLYRRTEKYIVIGFFVICGVMAGTLPYITSSFLLRESPLLRQMVRNAQRESFLIPPLRKENLGDWRGMALMASYEMQQGHFDVAKGLYERAEPHAPSTGMLAMNLGNLAFYTHEYANALSYYQRALAQTEDPTSLYYNMSLTYREMLLFEEGEKKYKEALAGDRKKAEQYAKEAILYPAHMLREGRFTSADLIEEALRHVAVKSIDLTVWQMWTGFEHLNGAPWMMGVAAAAFWGGSIFLKKKFTAKRCEGCQRSICDHCWMHVLENALCMDCAAKPPTFIQTHETGLKKGIALTRKDIVLMFVPGLAHLDRGYIRRGFIFLTLFYWAIVYIGIGEYLFSTTQWHLKAGGPWAQIYFVTLYITAGLTLLYPKRKASWKVP